jgi:hypothetical protein
MQGAWWFVERLPPLRWLKELAQRIMGWPAKYSWWFAAVGSLIGLGAGIPMGDTTSLVIAIAVGAVAGRILLPVVAVSLLLVATFAGLAIVLAIIGACVAAIVFLLNHLKG